MHAIYKKVLLLLLVVGLLFSLCGCYDYYEPEDVTFVIAVGVDKGENTAYKITFQGMATSKIKSSEQGTEGHPVYNTAIEAADFQNAVDLANSFLADYLSFAQTKLIVFSEELAKNDLSEILFSFARNADFSADTYVAISRGSAYDFLKSVQPVLTQNPSKFYEMIFESEDEEYIPIINLTEVYYDLVSGEQQPVFPLVAVNKSKLNQDAKPDKEDKKEENGDGASGQREEGSESKGKENEKDSSKQNSNKEQSKYGKKDSDAAENYLAGDLERVSENNAEVLGMAVLGRDHSLAAIATAAETKYYNMISGDFEQLGFSVDQKTESGNAIGASLTGLGHPTYQVEIKDGIPHIAVTLTFLVDTIHVAETYRYTEDRQSLEHLMEEHLTLNITNFLYKTSREYKSDIFGFFKTTKKQYWDYDALRQNNWADMYENAEFTVVVEVTHKRNGIMYDTSLGG